DVMKKQVSAIIIIVLLLGLLPGSAGAASQDHVTRLTNSPFTRRLITNVPAITDLSGDRLGAFGNQVSNNIVPALNNQFPASAPPLVETNLFQVFPGPPTNMLPAAPILTNGLSPTGRPFTNGFGTN